MNILIVDLTNISYRYIDKPHQRDSKIVDMVMSFAKSFEADKIICAKDTNGSGYRRQKYIQYKANRVQNMTEQDKAKRDLFLKDIDKAVTLLKHLEVPILAHSQIEADDIICWLSEKYPDATLLSGDYDLTQLDLKQFSPFKSQYITYKDFGCDTAKEYVLTKAIAGDNSDNIDGVYGIGVKTAVSILKKYNVSNIDDLEQALKNAPKKLGKREQSILDNIELIKANLFLVDLKLVNSEIITNDIEKIFKEVLGEY